jgi:hypothetical protein
MPFHTLPLIGGVVGMHDVVQREITAAYKLTAQVYRTYALGRRGREGRGDRGGRGGRGRGKQRSAGRRVGLGATRARWCATLRIRSDTAGGVQVHRIHMGVGVVAVAMTTEAVPETKRRGEKGPW